MRIQATLAYAGAVSSQFEPTAADGDSESCSVQAQINKLPDTATVGSMYNMLPVTGLEWRCIVVQL